MEQASKDGAEVADGLLLLLFLASMMMTFETSRQLHA